MKKRKRKLKVKNLVIITIICLTLSFGLIKLLSIPKIKEEEMFLASDKTSVSLYNEKKEEVLTLSRGNKVLLYKKDKIDDLVKIKYDEKYYYINNENLVNKIEDVVLEKEIFVRTAYHISSSLDTSKLIDLVNKGERLEVTGYDTLNSDGTVYLYKVKTSNQEEGYFFQKYTSLTKEESLADYNENNIYNNHKNVKDTLGGGNAASLDYYPVIKPVFDNNKMPEQVYSLYLNGSREVIKNVDKYIEYAKTTKINAFVVDIKDGYAAYKSNVMKDLSPSSYKSAQNSLEDYKTAIQKLKDNGFYVIGRITTFKDSYYIKDHKETAITDGKGNPLYHNSSYWPCPFNRDVWFYTLEIAKEAVTEMGFNEIQFDYVRFPDRLQSLEKSNKVSYNNIYNETKAEAIQRFLMYVTNELHKLNVYVSCDVFGESVNGYVTAYGQYWPAMSNVVDAISAMPYTDHFERVSTLWENPYNTMSNWGMKAKKHQSTIPTPAVARTWITAYDTPYWNPTVSYNGQKLSEQIEALYKQGLNGGYMTWNAGSNLNKYKLQKSAFDKEYK